MRNFENTFCALWHLGLAAMGAVEFKQRKSRTMKVLAVGFVAFHLDAFINDRRGTETYIKRGLRRGAGLVRDLRAVRQYNLST